MEHTIKITVKCDECIPQIKELIDALRLKGITFISLEHIEIDKK